MANVYLHQTQQITFHPGRRSIPSPARSMEPMARTTCLQMRCWFPGDFKWIAYGFDGNFVGCPVQQTTHTHTQTNMYVYRYLTYIYILYIYIYHIYIYMYIYISHICIYISHIYIYHIYIYICIYYSLYIVYEKAIDCSSEWSRNGVVHTNLVAGG